VYVLLYFDFLEKEASTALCFWSSFFFSFRTACLSMAPPHLDSWSIGFLMRVNTSPAIEIEPWYFNYAKRGHVVHVLFCLSQPAPG